MEHYVIRFREKLETKTIKFCDYDSLKYFMDILEQKDIEYVIYKNLNQSRIDLTLKMLLEVVNNG